VQPEFTEDDRPRLRLVGPTTGTGLSSVQSKRWHPSSRARDEGPLLYICGDRESRIIFIRIARRWESMRLVVADGWRLGLHLAAKRRPRLVVLDARMHDVDGADIVKHLRQRVLPSHTPIVVLGHELTPTERARFLWAGASAYHATPLNVAEIDGSVAALLEIAALR
jgi:DNA-binding response OmpR family regulator